jgi:hypothetical protein
MLETYGVAWKPHIRQSLPYDRSNAAIGADDFVAETAQKAPQLSLRSQPPPDSSDDNQGMWGQKMLQGLLSFSAQRDLNDNVGVTNTRFQN